jgi:1-acyl-sn-glycerol-3-phosphate acyltransferase
MFGHYAHVPVLRDTITDEIFIALGYPSDGWQRKLLWPLFWPPAHQFAKLAASVDHNTENYGVVEAARRLLARFTRSTEIIGAENIPREGPLLIASNHPGAYDSVAIIASLPREDLRVIVSGVPFLRSLPTLKRHLIYSAYDAYGRMAALRALIRHMKDGGVSLIFPSGVVDPDPAVLPGAHQALGAWSSSLELILRRVPEIKILVSIVSGVLAPACLRNPITRLPKEKWRQQKLAEFFQVMQQLFFPHSFGLTPRISFGEPLSITELPTKGDAPAFLDGIIEQARQLLAAHMALAEPEIEAVSPR